MAIARLQEFLDGQEAVKPSQEDIRKGKKFAVSHYYGSSIENVDSISDEQLDDLLGKMNPNLMDENQECDLEELIDCMKAVHASPTDMVEAIRVHGKMKLDEAQEVYKDFAIQG